MKNKRLLFGCFISVMSLALSACNFLPSNFLPSRERNSSSKEDISQREEDSSFDRSSKPSSETSAEHVHTFDNSVWKYSNTTHWHPATCGHSIKGDNAPHDFVSSITREANCYQTGIETIRCTVCGYHEDTVIPMTDHQWVNYGSSVEPTCTENGSIYRYCSICGTEQRLTVAALGHDFVRQYYVPETGYYEEVCSRCGLVQSGYDYSDGHDWYGESYHAPSDGHTPYYTYYCNHCNAQKIEFYALDGQFDDGGSNKAGTPDGFMKLNSNNTSIKYLIDLDYNYYGVIYQHAMLDSWQSNQGRGYTYHSISGNINNTEGEYNFRLTVNGQDVDLSSTGNIPYDEWLNRGVDYGLGSNYSPVADCEIGEVQLVPGMNEIRYSRLNSYNLIIQKFVIVLYQTNHTHTKSASLNYDENGHWYRCTDPNCPNPNTKLNYESHAYDSRVITEATCDADGVMLEECARCGYQRYTALPRLSHNWSAVGTFEKGEGSAQLDEYECSQCNKCALRWNALDYDTTESNDLQIGGDYVRFTTVIENRDGMESRGAHLVYKINVPKAQRNVGLAFYARPNTSAPVFSAVESDSYVGYYQLNDGSFEKAPVRYGLRVNGQEIRLGDDLYGRQTATDWYQWPVSFNLVAGLNTIDLYCMGSYRAYMYQFQITDCSYMTPNHTHTAGSGLYYDDNNHWHECSSGDGYHVNVEPHIYLDYSEWVEPTCDQDGYRYRTCSICGYQQYEFLPATGHQYGEPVVSGQGTCESPITYSYTCTICGHVRNEEQIVDHDFGETLFSDYNSDGKLVSVRKCNVCQKSCSSLNFEEAVFESGSMSNNKIAQNSVLRWNIPVVATGKASIYVPIMIGSDRYSQNFDASKYGVSVNGVNQEFLLPTNVTYQDVGFDTYVKYFKIGEYNVTNEDLANGELAIRFIHNNNTYRLTFQGEFRVIWG